MTRLPILVLAVLSLAACNKPGGERRQAAGEILDGSVSDAMIATDQLRSEGPYAAPKTAEPGKGGKASVKTAGKPNDQTEPAGAASETPAATPEPTPTPETSG